MIAPDGELIGVPSHSLVFGECLKITWSRHLWSAFCGMHFVGCWIMHLCSAFWCVEPFGVLKDRDPTESLITSNCRCCCYEVFNGLIGFVCRIVSGFCLNTCLDCVGMMGAWRRRLFCFDPLFDHSITFHTHWPFGHAIIIATRSLKSDNYVCVYCISRVLFREATFGFKWLHQLLT